MPLALTQPADDSIQVRSLRDGQFAVIVEWSTNPAAMGDIVQRCGLDLRNHRRGTVWPQLFNEACLSQPHYRVCVLSDGTTLTIYDNE